MKEFFLSLIRKVNRKLLVAGRDIKSTDISKMKYCPCCQNYVRRMVYNNYHFHPEQVNPRLYLPEKRKTECPYCGALARHRLLMWYFMEHVQELKNCTGILYFAFDHVMKRWLNDNDIPYTTADLLVPADLQIDIEDTGLRENSYAYIVCNHVLEHVKDFQRALKEVYRILAPQGIFICSFPILDSLETYIEAASPDITEKEKIERFGQRDHLRIFGRDSKELLERAGFTVEVYDKTKCPEYIVPLDGPAAYDKTLLFLCRKQ